MKTKPIASAALLVAALIISGCSTTKEPDYRPEAMAPTARVGREGGMEVVVDPFAEPKRCKQYFGINAAGEGIGIVFVRISNNTSNQTFLVEKKNLQLVPTGAATGQDAGATTITRGKAGGESIALLGAATGGLGGIGLMLGGGSMISHATEVQRNFVGKEMPDQTLSPGRNMEGFVYFKPVPKDAGWVRGATIKINLTEIKSHEILAVAIPLSP